MTSPLAGATLTAQRAQNRWKKYYVAVVKPNSVYTARINQTFPDGFDGIVHLTYDTGSGTVADIKPGMTLWIGSSAGAHDIGIVRIRKAATASRMYIGKVSGLQFADNQYLTVLDEFALWQKEPRSTAATTLMDEDVIWSAAQAGAPIVRIGPPAVILSLTGATVSKVWAAPAIYSPTGTTAASYLWTAPGASATSNLTTATPTITYNAAGTYYVSCALTDSAGGVTTVTRRVLVNPTPVSCVLTDMSGDIDQGGWSASIEAYGTGLTTADLYDRAMVILYKEDYVGTAADTQYGPYAGYENIRMIGWVDGESVRQNPDYGTLSFTIHGPAYWLDKISGAPFALTDATATTWNTVATLTTNKALYRIARWQSTLSEITDVTLTGDSTRMAVANVNTGSLRQQIDGLAGEKILARMACNRYGCAFVNIPTSLLDSTGKAAVDVLWDTSSSDWAEEIGIDRVTSGEAAMIEIGGAGYDGSAESPYFSRAPGNTPGRYGAVQAEYSTLALASQTVANRLCGDILADRNREYPTVDMRLYWSNDYIDIAPAYLVRVSVAAADTPRGITWTTKRCVPEAVGYEYDAETGAESTAITLAEETTGNAGVSYYPPEPNNNNNIEMPGLPEFPGMPGIGTWFPEIEPPTPPGSGCGTTAPSNRFGLIFTPGTLTNGQSAKAYFPCTLRPASYDNGPTTILLELSALSSDRVDCYAIDASGNRLLSGTVSMFSAGSYWGNTTVTFAPVTPLAVAGFEIVAHCFGIFNPTKNLYIDTAVTTWGERNGAFWAYDATKISIQTQDELGLGHVRISFADSVANTHSILGCIWELKPILSKNVADTGVLYAVIRWESTSTGAAVADHDNTTYEPNPWVAHSTSWNGLWTVYNPFTGGDPAISWFVEQNIALASVYGAVDLYFCDDGTIIPSSINIGLANIFNVCP